MAKLRAFISSTCYDLAILRSELRPFIAGLGYEPVMSEYSDILYDPRSHTTDSCLKEVPSCDIVVLIIGSRFGGIGAPRSFSTLDFEKLRTESTEASVLDNKEKLSVTQLEVLKAVEESIPVYAFVDANVLSEYYVYDRNKDKPGLIEQIDFPSIQQRDTAQYIFEFINFITHRVTNNSITGFSRLDDIRGHLVSQLSQLFKRFLMEARIKTQEATRYKDFSESLDDLKTVILASLSTPDLREIAKGAVRYRHLLTFVASFPGVDRSIILSNDTLSEIFDKLGVRRIIESSEKNRPRNTYFILSNGFYRCRFSLSNIERYKNDWDLFRQLKHEARAAIADAIIEENYGRPNMALSYVQQDYDEYVAEREIRMSGDVPDGESSNGHVYNVDLPGEALRLPN